MKITFDLTEHEETLLLETCQCDMRSPADQAHWIVRSVLLVPEETGDPVLKASIEQVRKRMRVDDNHLRQS